ncbi:hypothetical protein Poli38472_006947 [Pythium oligandrum]|uniref:Cation/H+ exchanger transmembrane domain-containing protein n=1 Tax=Pythium oligandrum TaxID=41045 RepID=A0A8K1FGK6_PYTOL|nr:hypothetical protein Poli38472_006947 [Pythium oligandrum]|eukprot:TMW58802.1 hypothetical protein Poli38472_006947 [Pythium oligandrum]
MAGDAGVVVPFGSADTIDDTLLHILGFLIVLAAAHPLGLLFPRFFKLPLITGYLLIGIITGPFLSNLITNESVTMLASSINAMALSFISFQAGQEIYLPELKPQIKGILQLLTMLYFTTMVLLTFILTVGAGPFFHGVFDTACRLAIALMFGSIAVLGSPATVMAIKIELNSVGPFTNLMLGATMTAELVVLISFSISRVISSVYCAKLDISFGNLMFTMGIVFSNLLIGAGIGLLIIAIFMIPGGDDGHHHHDEHKNEALLVDQDHPPAHGDSSKSEGKSSIFGSLYFKGFLWLVLGYVFYISTNTISQATIAAYGHVWDVKFEPLLVLMVASCVAGHYGHIRHDMHIILDRSAPIVFLPFFVMTGAALKLDQVAGAIPLMSLFVGLRYAAIFLACYGAGRFILKLPPQQYNNLWLTMTPQAGVALGLANEVKGLSSDPWAAEFAATIVAAVVVNQIVGPVFCAMGLSRAGESSVQPASKSDSGDSDAQSGQVDRLEAGAGKKDDSERWIQQHGRSRESRRIQHAVVIGDDSVACEWALQLALYGANVSMPVLDDARQARWESILELIRSQKSVVSAELADEFAQELATRSTQGGDDDQDQEEMVSMRARTAMAMPTDLMVFTGDDHRALEHIKLLSAMAMGRGSMPRLIAVTKDATLVDALRQRGVLCIQPSISLSNVGMRLALLDDMTAQHFVLCETSAPEPLVNAEAFIQTTKLPAMGATLLTHRRGVLQRNMRYARHLQSMNTVDSDGPVEAVAPPRVSMFGRSSAANGPEFFLASARRQGRNTRYSTRSPNFVGANDMYIIGDNGEGGFEDTPLDVYDDIAVLGGGAHSARAGVFTANTTPGRPPRPMIPPRYNPKTKM